MVAGKEAVLVLVDALHADRERLVRQLLQGGGLCDGQVRWGRQAVQDDLGQERPVQHLVAVEQVPVEDKFQAVGELASAGAGAGGGGLGRGGGRELEVEHVGQRADPVGGLLLEACDCVDVDFDFGLVGRLSWAVVLVEEVEDAVAEASQGDLGEVVVPDYFALGLEAVGWGGVECWVCEVPDRVFENIEFKAKLSGGEISAVRMSGLEDYLQL